jgi:activator of HSP90 ATPase
MNCGKNMKWAGRAAWQIWKNSSLKGGAMAKTVVQKIKFKTTPDKLYQIYMDAKKHAAATGAKVSLEPVVGGKFSAFGMLKGRFLLLEKGKRIVQTWRGKHWKKTDPDSLLILNFKKVPGGGEIDMVHTHIPNHDFKGIQKGWPQHYWRPWKKYLEK